jgi:hypothetical protein
MWAEADGDRIEVLEVRRIRSRTRLEMPFAS